VASLGAPTNRLPPTRSRPATADRRLPFSFRRRVHVAPTALTYMWARAQTATPALISPRFRFSSSPLPPSIRDASSSPSSLSSRRCARERTGGRSGGARHGRAGRGGGGDQRPRRRRRRAAARRAGAPRRRGRRRRRQDRRRAARARQDPLPGNRDPAKQEQIVLYSVEDGDVESVDGLEGHLGLSPNMFSWYIWPR
jgi:hypothetical protein